MYSPSCRGRVTPVAPLIALVVFTVFSALPALAQGETNSNAKLDGWIVDYGRPTTAMPDSYQMHFERGEDLVLDGDLNGAAREFLECIRIFEPYIESGELRGDYKDAIVREAFFLPLAKACVNLGHTFTEMGRLETAIKLYTGAADVTPGYAAAHEALGTALITKGMSCHARREAQDRGIGQIKADETEMNLYRAAIAHLHVARQLDPANAGTHLALSIALREWGDIGTAIQQAEIAVACDPDDPEIQYNLGLALVSAGGLAPAAEAYAAALGLAADMPDEYQAMLQDKLGLALAGLGEFDDSLKAHRKAVALAPHVADYQNNLGGALRISGSSGASSQAHASAAALAPDTIEYYLNLAASDRDAGNISGAIIAYRKALRLNSDEPEIHHQLGLALYERSDPDTVMGLISAVKDATITDDAVESALAVIATHYMRARRLRLVDAMDPRCYDITPRLLLTPSPWPGLKQEMGRLWATLDERPLYGDTRLELQELLTDYKSVEPAVLALVGNYQKILRVQGAGFSAAMPLELPESVIKFAGADSAMATSIDTLAPEVRRATLAAAMAVGRQDNLAEAIAELRWAMRINPGSALIANNLGKALFDAGQSSNALGMFDRSIRLAGDISETHFNRGVALADLNQMDRAMAAWNEALDLGMQDVRLYTYLGVAYVQKTEFDRANAMFESAMRVDADYAPTKYYLGLLKALLPSASPITGQTLQKARLSTAIGRPHYDVRAEFIKMDELGGAMAMLRQADAADPDRREMYYYIGVELGLQDPALSEESGADVIHCVTRVRGLAPDWTATTNNIAVCAALDGDLAKAEKLLRTAVADEPDYALAHWNLGRVLMMSGKEGEGKEELWTGVELARKQGLPYYFEAQEPVEKVAVVTPPPPAPLPLQAAEESRLKTLLQAFDIPVPYL